MFHIVPKYWYKALLCPRPGDKVADEEGFNEQLGPDYGQVIENSGHLGAK